MGIWSWAALLAATLLASSDRDRRRRGSSEPTLAELVDLVLEENKIGPEERRELAAGLVKKGHPELAKKVRATLERSAAERLLDEVNGLTPVQLLMLSRENPGLVEGAQRELGVEPSGWYDVPTARALRRVSPEAPSAAWLGPLFRVETTGPDGKPNMATIGPADAPAALAALAGLA